MLGTTSQLLTLVAIEETVVEKTKAVADAVTPFYQQGWFVTIVTLVALVAIWWLAHQIAKAIKMPDYGGRLATIGLSTAIASIFILNGWPPKLGVDLSGGVNIIGQLNLSEINDPDAPFGSKNVTAEDIIPNLLKRVDPSGTKEILIRALGRDKIEVIIPDVDLIEAEEIWYRLSKTGHLQFRIGADRRHNAAAIAIAEELAAQGETSRTVYSGKGDEQKAVAKWYNIARMDRTKSMEPEDLLPIKYRPRGPNYLLRDKRSGRIISMSEFRFDGKVTSPAAIKTIKALKGTRDYTEEMIEGLEMAEQLIELGYDTPQMLMMEPKLARHRSGQHCSFSSNDPISDPRQGPDHR